MQVVILAGVADHPDTPGRVAEKGKVTVYPMVRLRWHLWPTAAKPGSIEHARRYCGAFRPPWCSNPSGQSPYTFLRTLKWRCESRSFASSYSRSSISSTPRPKRISPSFVPTKLSAYSFRSSRENAWMNLCAISSRTEERGNFHLGIGDMLNMND